VGTDGAAVGGAAVVAVHWQCEAGQLGGIWLQVLVHHASVAVELMAMHGGAGVGGADVSQSSHSLQLAPQAHFSDQGFALTAHQDKQFGLGGVGAGTAVDGAAVGGAAVVAGQQPSHTLLVFVHRHTDVESQHAVPLEQAFVVPHTAGAGVGGAGVGGAGVGAAVGARVPPQ